MTAAEWIQVILTGLNTLVVLVLVGVTLWYAKSTHDMAEEMKEARFAAFRPLLVLRPSMPGRQSRYLTKENVGYSEEIRLGAGVEVHNMGTGPALDIRWHGEDNNSATVIDGGALGLLGVGEYTEQAFRPFPQEEACKIAYLVANYQDVFDNPHTTRQQVEYDQKSGSHRVLGPIKMT